MRLGDLDALKKILEELAKDKFDSLYGDGIYRAIKEIDNAPTVAGIPQGKWIIDQEGDKNTITLVTCPFCGERHCCKMNFCGNCGADMRGKE